MRIKAKPAFPNQILLPTSPRFLEDEAIFQITIDVGNIIGQTPMDRFSVPSRIKNLPVEIPLPKVLFQRVVEPIPFFNSLANVSRFPFMIVA